jgi:hypothetical protein
MPIPFALEEGLVGLSTFKQCLCACASIVVSAPLLAPHQAPGIVYALIALAGTWSATWLHARKKYGRDVRIRFNLRADD